MALIVAVTIIEHGGTVAILDVENGEDEYARRLADILAGRTGLDHACRDRLRYHAWPTLRTTWTADDWAAALTGTDLVIFDSSRLILSSAGLAEDDNDDYSTFVATLLIPLARSGITTLVLDNTGHDDKDRARGASGKADLNEVIYSVAVGEPFDRDRAGHLRLIRRRGRFAGLPGELHVPIGAGTYGPPHVAEPQADAPSFRPTHYMEQISRAIEAQPGLSKRAIRAAVKGTKDNTKDLALEVLIAEGHVEARNEGRATRHHPIKPYRQDQDGDRG